MDLDLPDVAVDFSRTVREAIADAGGIEVARQAETNPSARESALELLSALGIEYLDPRTGPEATLIATEVCRAVGEAVLPVPISSLLLAREGAMPVLVGETSAQALVNHADIGNWIAMAADGAAFRVSEGRAMGQRLAPFAAEVEVLESAEAVASLDVALWLTLEAHVALGAIERALAISAEHLKDRRQFGAPLATFQALRFRVAECAVELNGARELGYYTAWRLHSAPDDALIDALALRICVQDAATRIFRECHLFHGAIGFCDEHDLSILSRHVQPHVRLPWGREATAELLLRQVDSAGFETLYGRIGQRAANPMGASG